MQPGETWQRLLDIFEEDVVLYEQVQYLDGLLLRQR